MSYVPISADFMEDPYTLEVSSPGVERPLKTDRDFLLSVQGTLFVVGGYLATDNSQRDVRPGNIVTDEMVSDVEREIDALQETVPPLRLFILPGGCRSAGPCRSTGPACQSRRYRYSPFLSRPPAERWGARPLPPYPAAG